MDKLSSIQGGDRITKQAIAKPEIALSWKR